MSTVPAWAAGTPGATTYTCGICGNQFTEMETTSDKGYEEYFGVASIAGLTKYNDQRYDYGKDIHLTAYNGEPICFDCLEAKVEASKTSQTGSTNINASIDSHYTLVVPESVTMTGDDNVDEKTATIPVTVKGNICEDQCVTVATSVTAMQRAGSKDAAATVTAPKTVWNYGDVTASNKDGTTSNYIVKATLSPGDWKGVATFTCTLGNAA